jgi:hypothetical protein
MGLPGLSLGDEPDIPGHIDPSGAGMHTRRRTVRHIFLRGHSPEGADDIQDSDSIRAHGLAPTAGGAHPGERAGSNIIHHIQFYESDDPSDIEILFAADGTGRTAAAALLTGPEHLHIIESFRQCRVRGHISFTFGNELSVLLFTEPINPIVGGNGTRYTAQEKNITLSLCTLSPVP